MEVLLGSTPNGSAPLYARACLEPFRAAPMKAQVRLASPAERWGGFGTCGWIGAGRPKSVQPLVDADIMPARVHAVPARDYDRLCRARLTTLAALWNCFGPRVDSESRRQGPSSTPPWTRRRGRTSGLDASRQGPLSRQPDASVDSIGCNLLLIRTFAPKEVAGPDPGQPVRPRRRHVT